MFGELRGWQMQVLHSHNISKIKKCLNGKKINGNTISNYVQNYFTCTGWQELCTVIEKGVICKILCQVCVCVRERVKERVGWVRQNIGGKY